MKQPKRTLERDIETLKMIAKDFHWMARRYADHRSSCVGSIFNDHTRTLLKLGVELNTCDDIIWARDGMGRPYDGLSEAEATPGTKEALGEK